jgi:hypothetical protein
MRVSKRRAVLRRVALCAALAIGCTGTNRVPSLVAEGALLREPGLRAPDDPTVAGPRVVPVTAEKATTWGVEPGGSVRATTAGLRLTSAADGVLRASSDRLPADPGSVVAIPERLGGGFLFAVGPHLWRSDTWLGPVSPLFTSPFPVGDLLVGMDRVYARSPQGALAAFDPREGVSLDLGPLPPSPHFGRIAAVDAWREVVIADLRGALVTLDAGSSWRPLGLPVEPNEVSALGDVIVVGGPDETRQVQWWAVGRDGQPGRLVEAPARFAAPELATRPIGAIERIFRPRPLVAAIEDGWPLADGTALVMRDGALARVRLTDGAVVESAIDAFPLNPARCHAVSLSRPGDPGAFGMICGEPRGKTIVYRWDAQRSRVIELRRFDTPREVLAFGNGALAARGPCSTEAPDERAGDQPFCVMPAGGPWSEMRFRGDDANLARLVVLNDGRIALVRPPRAGNLTSASLTVTDGVHTTQLPLRIPLLGHDTVQALRLGIWTDGFEERRPGVLGGWVDAAGTLLGLEITLDGELRVGEYISDEGAPVASGRWALGWTASRRGFETTDGGMTWAKGLDLPEPIGSVGAASERACGPIGCVVAGWLRIGWGSAEDASPPGLPLPNPLRAPRTPPPLHLDCEQGAGNIVDPASPPHAAARPGAAPPFLVLSFGKGALYGPGSTLGTVTEFPSFCGRAAPHLRPDERGFTVDVPDVERPRRTVAEGVLYAWGPAAEDWDGRGKWEMRWQWPWGGCSSASGAAPWNTLDAARRALGKGIGAPTFWVVAPGDDADHALFIARHTLGPPTADVFEIETGRPPVEVRRPGGDPFPDVEGAIRVGGRWYLATGQPPSELAAAIVWSLDGGEVHEVARLPRAGVESVHYPLRLARRADGRSIGLALEGQLRVDGPPLLWVASIDVDTGAVGDPEPIGAFDLSDRTVTLCTGDDVGWRLVLPYPGSVDVAVGGTSSSLRLPVARMRISRNGACLESILGSWDEYASTQAQRAATRTRDFIGGSVRTIEVGVLSSGKRFPLICSQP